MDLNPNTYLYNAQGHGVSAQFVRPFQQTIDVQAGMSLSTTGGYGFVRVTDFRYKGFLSFKSASTQVSGSFHHKDNSHTTLVSVDVEGLNVFDVLTADRVVARIASRHVVDTPEPEIVFVGSYFENLRIAGCLVECDLDHDLFLRLDTFRKFRDELQSNKKLQQTALDPYHTGTLQPLPDKSGMVLCSLVKDMKVDCPGVEQVGHVFYVREFGKIYLAEVVTEDSHRILTMLRFELGSPGGGSGTASQGQSNGQQYPPTP
jgi:hypothetical protein